MWHYQLCWQFLKIHVLVTKMAIKAPTGNMSCFCHSFHSNESCTDAGHITEPKVFSCWRVGKCNICVGHSKTIRSVKTGWKVVAALLPDNWNHFWPILQWAPPSNDLTVRLLHHSNLWNRFQHACMCMFIHWHSTEGTVFVDMPTWCTFQVHSVHTNMHACAFSCHLRASNRLG